MEGMRVYDRYPSNPGEYKKLEDGISWLLCVPTGVHGTINNRVWSITEHDDGTITVSPSIKVVCHVEAYNWHGYLEEGIWQTC